MRVRVSIIGASGYGGGELVRILAGHPEVEIVHLAADSHAGQPMDVLFPNLKAFTERMTESPDIPRIASDSDVVFLALPNGLAMDLAPPILESGARVIDLGADFRFKKAEVYERWYKTPHRSLHYLEEAVYGLPELNRAAIRGARLVANPGCYPTAALIALLPILRHPAASRRGIIVDAKSGVSGAGRGISLGTHFSEVNENVKPYNVAAHRHTPEIIQELESALGEPVSLTFTPHLIPMTRGILVTAYIPLREDVTGEDLRGAYEEAYAGEPFVRVLSEELPQTKATLGSNFCDVAVRVDRDAGMAIAMAALDNLVKGASGQAVQNMNLMLGFPEDLGLRWPGLYP
ncbi:MAG: N-acetyl-gamma-glutamyl-phosphate reductase [Armatimonadota bacterium]|nr:N-acetyl-gamma-glutamyl-phosphate reductase [Armatimonadota bacterium]